MIFGKFNILAVVCCTLVEDFSSDLLDRCADFVFPLVVDLCGFCGCDEGGPEEEGGDRNATPFTDGPDDDIFANLYHTPPRRRSEALHNIMIKPIIRLLAGGH